MSKHASGKRSAYEDGTPGQHQGRRLREDSTLAGFSFCNMAAVTRSEAFEQPTAVIDARSAKLGCSTSPFYERELRA
ncbi:hypothetical protein [Streptomyces violarus]|uniref:hypothetical protein n=1 Tax=Streptomyces violarus TaxID=67380 RepID=UPI0021C0556D|nr:hypothetical protein [Streptomyces violarus]MCT9139141.1 hypothetical protein [Streptomyces violarus]